VPRCTCLTCGYTRPVPLDRPNYAERRVLLDRSFSSLPAGLPPDRTMFGLFMNFSRLTDKALRELRRGPGRAAEKDHRFADG
jgi:hypothetical protein